jgi:hypothetical protein
MFETIGILVVFFFLLVIAAMFYFNLKKSEIEKELTKQTELRAFRTSETIFYLPELDCSFSVMSVPTCFDELKLNNTKEIFQKGKFYYSEIFGASTIKIKKIWPSESEMVLYDSKPAYAKDEKIKKSGSPIHIYNPKEDSYAFGVVEVDSYG